MGVDATIEFQSPVPLTQKEQKHLAARLNEAMGSLDYTILEATDESVPTYEVITPWRYYGPGYERGPWPTIRAILVWLMRNTNGVVFYGGDCDDAKTHVGHYELDKMDAHWAKVGHRPYRGPGENGRAVECEDCGIDMNEVAFYLGNTDLACPGCGKTKTVTR